MSYNKSEYNRVETLSMPQTFATVMRNVYTWMCGGLLMTALTAMTLAKNANIMYTMATNSMLVWGLMIAEIALVVILSARLMKMSFVTAGLMFAAYSILNGATLSFIFMIYTLESIASTFFITAGTFGAMSLFGYITKRDLSTMGRILFMTLIGLVIASVVNMFVASSGLTMILNYVGVLVFVGLTAYDTQKIKVMLETVSQQGNEEVTQKVALLGSLTLYLDFINLFLYLLRLFGTRRD